MTLFAIYSRPDEGPEAIAAVPQGFSWAAFLLMPVWALFHRAWLILGVWIVAVLALERIVPAIGADAAVALYCVLALWTGFAAPDIRGRGYVRRGWLAHGELSAPSVEGAETLWLKTVYGARA